MIYRVRKGTTLHNKLLEYIAESDKWLTISSLLDNIFECDMSKVGYYTKLNQSKSLKVNYQNLPKSKQQYFDRTGWLLPNNEYYDKWMLLVDKINPNNIEKDYLNHFKLSIFIEPQCFIDINNFDLLIKVKDLLPKDEHNSDEYKVLEDFYETTTLEDFPV